MLNNITISIHLFGAFRIFLTDTPIVIQVPSGATLADVKNAIGKALVQICPTFDKYALINESALADETQVLQDDTTFTQDAKLAILPPVCGG